MLVVAIEHRGDLGQKWIDVEGETGPEGGADHRADHAFERDPRHRLLLEPLEHGALGETEIAAQAQSRGGKR